MKIEIWSDIMCPFCYIGKRHFEQALKEFGDVKLEIEWKSFQLDPSLPETSEEGVYEYLAKRKGFSVEQSKAMHNNVVKMAANVGLEYNFDIAKVANSFKAHRIIQAAKQKGYGDTAEEIFFRSYFTEGKDLGSREELLSIGTQIGLRPIEIDVALSDERYESLVKEDIREAQQLGINAVPFLVMDRKYGVSGAQPVEVFVKTIAEALNEVG